ncbi:MAG: thioredoxin family protein [Patescibacteria group bacterium]|nr:thioredoxin family protein [Patescibacteria group bacterium]
MKVIKIGAVWCSGCLVMQPRWKKIEDEMPELKTQYYDFDNDKKQIERYKVEGGKLPVFIFLDKKGNELKRLTGEISIKELVKIIGGYKDK